jgi:hypothetical protein
MQKWQVAAVLAAGAGMFGLGVVSAQQAARVGTLTGQDYAEIEQLIYTYGYAIDTCAGSGYEYADLYTPDGVFVDNFTEEGFKAGGLQRASGREQLARAAGGGTAKCENVGWKDWSHLMLNPVIRPTADGAHGRTYTVVIGEGGPNHVQRFGGYEDDFVKTADGWRIKKRIHVRNKAWSHPLLQTPDLN